MTASEIKVKSKADDSSDKKNQKPTEKIDITLLEEDDDFEEFPAHACGDGRPNEEATVWEDNWDDDIVDDEFTHHLRNFGSNNNQLFGLDMQSINNTLDEYITTGSPSQEFYSGEVPIKRSPESYSNEFGSVNPQHDDDLYKSVFNNIRPLDEFEAIPSHSPEETLLLTNVNGFWKQENIKWSSNSPNCSSPTSPSFSCHSVSSDSLSDEPEHKPQPFLRSRHDSSSEEVSRADEMKENMKSIRPTFMRHMQFSTKICTQWRQNLNKSHIVQSSLNSTARKKALLAKAVSRKLIYSKLSKSSSVQVNHCREPWQVGELVWARPNWPENLPWWPAIITEKPKKYQAKSFGSQSTDDFNDEIVPTFRVCLLGIIRPLSFLTLPQTRLRLFSGREEFESFFRQTILEAKDKVRALRQFTIQPSMQSAWHRAREAAVAAKLTKPSPNDRLALFPWATEPIFRKLDPLSEFVRKSTGKFTLNSKSRKRPHRDDTSEGGGSFLSSSSSSSSTDDSNTSLASDSDIDSNQGRNHHRSSSYISSSTSTSSIGHRKRLKLSNNDHAKNEKIGQRWIDLANSFEFEKLRFGHTAPKHHFMCSVCGEFNNNTTTTNNTTNNNNNSSAATTTTTTTPTINTILQSDVTHTTTLLDSQKIFHQQHDKLDNLIMPCVGYCGNYLHLNCAPYVFYRSIKQKNLDHNGTDDNNNNNNSNNNQTTATSSTTTNNSNNNNNNTKDIKCSIITKDLTIISETKADSIQPNPVCNLCLAGLRQCFICYLTHPDPHLLTLQGSNCSETPSVDHANSDSSIVDKTISEVTIKIEDGANDVSSHQKEIQLISETSKSELPKSGDQMIRCSVRACRRWYHPGCLRKPPFAVVVREGRSGSFTCPAHTCLACSAETPGTMPRPSPHFIRCVMCPAAYHPGDWCLPAGSKEIAPNLIICPRHALQDECKLYTSPPNIQLKLPSSGLLNMFRPTNVSWCFICSKGGRIICCENCPASFHEECLKIDEVPDKFICEDCTNGRMLRYGEIVWARLPPSLQLYHQRSLKLSGVYNSHRLSAFNLSGTMRSNDYASLTAGMYWWPGELVHPRHLQTNHCHVQSDNQTVSINFQPTTSPTSHSFNHILGSVLVRLFGLNGRLSHRHSRPVYLWTTRARLFPYEEGDDKRGASSNDDDDDESTESEREGDVSVKKKCHTKQRTNRSRRHHHGDDNDDDDDNDGEDEDPLLELNSSNLLVEENHNNNNKSLNTSSNENNNSMESPTGSINKSTSRLSRNLCLRPRVNNKCVNDENSTNCTPNSQTPPSVIRRRKFIYNAALKQAARGYLKRQEKFSELLGRTRRPDYYKPIKSLVRIYFPMQFLCRCGEKDAPIGKQSLLLSNETLAVTNSSHTNTTSTTVLPSSSNKSLNKRGLKRELEDLVASVVNHSPSKNQHGLSSPTLMANRNETQSLVSMNTTTATTTTTMSTIIDNQKSHKPSDLILCSKHDCSKVYHLFCLDLDTPPQGQWFCPWHHCDACGRPSYIFCSICPSSFCLAHVEGSIVVLPPVLPKRNSKQSNNNNNNANSVENRNLNALLARIVCMFHHDLINNIQNQPVLKKKKLNSSISKIPQEDGNSSSSNSSSNHSSGMIMTRRRSVLRQSTMSKAKHDNHNHNNNIDDNNPSNHNGTSTNNSTNSCGLETKENDCLSNGVNTTPNRTIETN
ncbi:unnamed protein product [Schistosoma turkestanicum]|nr:unnamed protein product [Schistosoma turkestanicum]